MGMYDSIRFSDEYIKEKLKLDPNEIEKDFQTKDFDCLLDTYIVNQDGSLLRKKYPRGNPEPFTHEDVGINFYTFGKDEEWIEFMALIKDNKITEIERLIKS